MSKSAKRKRKEEHVEMTAHLLTEPLHVEAPVEEEVREHESPEEFARRFFGDGSPREAQEGLPSLEWLKSQYKTKSAAIRYLFNQGHQPKVIAKHLGIRYQHARNVCITPLKRGPNEDWRPKQPFEQ